MPRQKRLDIPGQLYHIINRGINHQSLFLTETDYNEFIQRLEKSLKETGCQCLAWCLMNNHFHLLIRSGKEGISQLMRKLLSGYATYFNKKHKRSGYLFQNRYKSIMCQEDVYLKELIRYIHLNPVRIKKIKTIEELDHYAFTGHSGIIGNINRTWMNQEEVLGLFGCYQESSKKHYRQYILDGFSMKQELKYSGGGLLRSAGGWEGVKGLRRMKEFWNRDERILGDGDFVSKILEQSEEVLLKKEKLKREGWDLEKIVIKICDQYDIKQNELFKKGRDNKISEAKSIVIYLAKKYLKISGTNLANHLRITKQAISWNYKKGEKIYDEKGLDLFES